MNILQIYPPHLMRSSVCGRELTKKNRDNVTQVAYKIIVSGCQLTHSFHKLQQFVQCAYGQHIIRVSL